MKIGGGELLLHSLFDTCLSADRFYGSKNDFKLNYTVMGNTVADRQPFTVNRK